MVLESCPIVFNSQKVFQDAFSYLAKQAWNNFCNNSASSTFNLQIVIKNGYVIHSLMGESFIWSFADDLGLFFSCFPMLALVIQVLQQQKVRKNVQVGVVSSYICLLRGRQIH